MQHQRILMDDILPAQGMFTSHCDKMLEIIEDINEKEVLNSEEYNVLLTSLMKMRNAFGIHNAEIHVLVEKNKEKTAKIVQQKSRLEFKDIVIKELQESYENEKRYSQMVIQDLQDELAKSFEQRYIVSDTQRNEKPKSSVQCSICKKMGHNKRTCPKK